MGVLHSDDGIVQGLNTWEISVTLCLSCRPMMLATIHQCSLLKTAGGWLVCQPQVTYAEHSHNNKLRAGSVQTHSALPFLSPVIQVTVALDMLLSIDSERLLDCFSIAVFPDPDAGAGEIWHPVLKSLFT